MLNNCCYCDFILLQLKLGKDQVFCLTCYMYISKYSNKTIARKSRTNVGRVYTAKGEISRVADGQGLWRILWGLVKLLKRDLVTLGPSLVTSRTIIQ